MFRAAFGLRSLPVKGGMARPMSFPAWTNTWARAFHSTETGQTTFAGLKTGLRQQRPRQRQRHQHLSPLRGTSSHLKSQPGLAFARVQRRGFRFSGWRRNTTQNGTQEKLTLSQKLKRLSKEYGWSAVGVYFALSILDFPLCFLLVRIVGTDTIGWLYLLSKHSLTCVLI